MTVTGGGAVVSLTYCADVHDLGRFAEFRLRWCFLWVDAQALQIRETDVIGAITRVGDAGVPMALLDAAKALLTQATKLSTLKRWAINVAKRRGMRRAKIALYVTWPRCFTGSERTGRSLSGARTRRPPPYAKEANS
nr:hypothetical protein [uncultured Lichenicoccus sp.]